MVSNTLAKWASLAFVQTCVAHMYLQTDGMYNPKFTSPTCNTTRDEFCRVLDPLWHLKKEDWWFQAGRGSPNEKPIGTLFLPANGAVNLPIQGATVATKTGDYGDFATFVQRPQPYDVSNPEVTSGGWLTSSKGLRTPNMHAGGYSTAGGTALSIAYVSDIADVTPENLVIISVAPNTPYWHYASYEIPNLAPCPAEGCICCWHWVPKGYGQQNMYMQGHRCQVTGSINGGARPQTPAKPPGPNVKGAKQGIYQWQLTGNNVPETVNGQVPTYSTGMGFMLGAQTDIFPSGSPAGTKTTKSSVKVCTGKNLAAPCQDLAFTSGQCITFTGTANNKAVHSFQPARGSCQFFSDAKCATPLTMLPPMGYPGLNDMGTAGGVSGSVKCSLL